MAGAGRIRADDANRIQDTGEAKARLLELLPSMMLKDILPIIGRSKSAYEQWRVNDPAFRAEVDAITERRRNGDQRKTVPDFEVFSEQYLHAPLYWHHLQWIDVLEGREPRDLHPSQTWEPGEPELLIINTPPNHGKSTVITQNYVTWRILKDPDLRVAIVSKTQGLARDFLGAVKNRLTHPDYRALQVAFGPTEGFEKTARSWTANYITLGDKGGQEKDPTVQALGIGGQIYGRRLDLIILDDCVDTSNGHQGEQQLGWLSQDVMSRPNADGVVVLVGTRVANGDLYSLVRERFEDFSYLTQPVILEETGDPATTKTLWPRSTERCKCHYCKGKGPDENGEYAKWDAEHLYRKRRHLGADTWARAYMQRDVSVDAVFPQAAVEAALNKQRFPGMMTAGYVGHRPEGMAGLYVLCSMDPALSGTCAASVYAVDQRSGKRWILDLHNEAGMSPRTIRELIYSWTEKYRPREWRIEKNAMQGMLTQDEELRLWLNARGCRLVEHFTGGNKWDADYGVASMATLFLPALEGRPPLIDIPANPAAQGNAANAVKALITQLIAWHPKPADAVNRRAKPGTTDLVMALWFAEIRAREIVMDHAKQAGHVKSPFTSRAELRNQKVIDINYFLEQEAQAAYR